MRWNPQVGYQQQNHCAALFRRVQGTVPTCAASVPTCAASVPHGTDTRLTPRNLPPQVGTGVPGVKNGVRGKGGCLTQGAADPPHTPSLFFVAQQRPDPRPAGLVAGCRQLALLPLPGQAPDPRHQAQPQGDCN